jgi:hypothetical protein
MDDVEARRRRGVFTDLAGRLADRSTVVSYDPRGNSRVAGVVALAYQRADA